MRRPTVVEPVSGTDMVMGAVMASGRLARRTTRLAGQVAEPVVRLAVDPPLVPHRWRPIRRLEQWAEEWRVRRSTLLQQSVEAGSGAVAGAAEKVLPLIDLTQVVNGVLDRLDLDIIAGSVLSDLDLAVVVDQVIDELDIGAVVNQALAEVDLTEVVISRVDLAAVVQEALNRLDLTEIVQERVDLAEIAEQVMDDIDLPEIIQESTGSVASEAVQSARLRSVDADEKIAQIADKVMLRMRRGRNLKADVALEAQQQEIEEREESTAERGGAP